MRIMKFGGKSLNTLEKVQKICKNIKKIYKNDKKIIIIVSAMGKTTDELIAKSKLYCKKNTPLRELDVLLSTGEMQSSALFAMVLNSMNIPAKSFQGFQLNISTFGAHQNSRISYINKIKLQECLDNDCVAVISGFQGINKNGDITTLGRGGSDTTAAAIGAIFNHDVEIYSDFDGVFAGDPIELGFKKLNNLSFDSMINIANSGAKVLDARASQIAKDNNIKIICKQSENFNKSGTMISQIENSFISISSEDNLCNINIDFSNNHNEYFLVKNVINSLKNYKIYNLTLKNNKIQLTINQTNKLEIMELISKKLKLLKNK